ncbi:MAG: phosphopyruvate hydratase, partial [Candidatus Pacebacteria bacterium]|nr:phosphopyruvate hydratase [Candidatus Paceibacterota bacterium]
MKITSIKSKEIKDSREEPTIEVEVCSGNICASASVPSGKSAGSREAKIVPVETAIKNIEEIIAPAILNLETDPSSVDKILIELDGTEDKSKLGGNTTLGVSLAVTRLASKLENKPLWKYINEVSKVDTNPALPKLFMNVINGGAHADFRIPFQESMIVTDCNLYDSAVTFLDKLGEVVKEKYG